MVSSKLSNKIELVYPKNNLNDFTPETVLNFYHVYDKNKQATICFEKNKGYCVKCINFLPFFCHEYVQTSSVWFRCTPYFKNLSDCEVYFRLTVFDMFGLKINRQILLDNSSCFIIKEKMIYGL